MKKKSLFNLLIIMVIVAFVGLGLTITLAENIVDFIKNKKWED